MTIESNILVSIITPVYNDDKYIYETLKSILTQSYSNFEVIIIDDCSCDNSFEIISKINDKRIKYFRNSINSGAAYSRNFGISKAKGDYIAFLDGDDIWDQTKLEKQLKFMIDNNYDFTYTNYTVFDSDSKDELYKMTGPLIINHSDFLRTDYIGCLTAMYKRAIYPDLNIPDDIKKRNDYALWLKLSEKCDCFLLDENLAYYRKRCNSISSGKKTKLFKYHYYLFKSLYHFSTFKCWLMAFRNVIFYFLKNKKYRR